MGDIAAVYHWPPAAMDPMELDELMRWHDGAVERLQAMHGGEG